jgi:Family of unknown function (DUF6477)
MTDLQSLIANLRRPRLLIRAARFGLADYRRERDLRRLIGHTSTQDNAVARLLSKEEEMEENRRAGTASYSVANHIELLIALICETRLLPGRLAN